MYMYRADNTTWGGYNHGPTITRVNGTYVMAWYNGVMNESVANRVLFATSTGSIALFKGFQNGANNRELRCVLRPSTEGASEKHSSNPEQDIQSPLCV